MTYNPEIPKDKYNNSEDSEWIRLEKDSHGILLYEVHLDILKRYIIPTDKVLEIGAGSGRYTKDLANMCSELTVADISSHQIAFNKLKMKELGLYNKIKEYHVLDMIDMSIMRNETFDCIVCIGGPINYLLDKEKDGIREMLRVLKPNGRLILGSMSFIGATLFFMEGIQREKEVYGIDATRWIFDTGLQDGVNYPSPKKHYVHMMRSKELDELFSCFDVNILEKSSAGLFSQVSGSGDEILENTRKDEELWNLIVEKELEFTKYPGTLDCGKNIIYVVQKK